MDEKKVRKAIDDFKELSVYMREKGYYGAIEHCDLAIEALEKQLPKKVEIWNGQATCPNCKKLYGNMVDIKRLHPASWDFEYCKHCG